MELRGFDAYRVTLGDEMRGERASLGKQLVDVERDLKIKAPLIEAVENCDLAAFPNQSVVAGYVRSYARYLGLDAERVFEQFCEESGYRSPVHGLQAAGGRPSAQAPLNAPVGAELGVSRFAAPPVPTRVAMPVSLGGVVSAMALVGVLSGIGYGGYALLQEFQRVGFAPLVEAPVVVAEAPDIVLPEADRGLTPPDLAAYTGEGSLAGRSVAVETPPPLYARRDGPISDLDPAQYGVFAQPLEAAPPLPQPEIDSADDAIAAAPEPEQAPPAPAPKGLVVHAAEEAWVRVRDRDTTLFEGILDPGQQFKLPTLADAATLRAGNAGGVYVVVDGVPYGPVGPKGRVKTLDLTRDNVVAALPVAESLELALDPEPAEVEHRAAVD